MKQFGVVIFNRQGHEADLSSPPFRVCVAVDMNERQDSIEYVFSLDVHLSNVWVELLPSINQLLTEVFVQEYGESEMVAVTACNGQWPPPRFELSYSAAI